MGPLRLGARWLNGAADRMAYATARCCSRTGARRSRRASSGSSSASARWLVVGLQGSDEWKHGSYGTKNREAMDYKRDGLRNFIVRQDIRTVAPKAA
ncbi:MAG: hypothetical protein K0R40_3875 [Burkholderiales bacterium]|jgi:hypothetical protein|nr:hypothetical protein [Burkholderiales bacterium]